MMRPPRSPAPKGEQAFSRVIPFLTALLSVLFSAAPLPVPHLAGIAPLFALMAIYYWSIYRPDLLRPLFVFLTGIFNDVVHMFPLGLSAFIFLILYQTVVSQRRFFTGQPFSIVWAGFAFVTVLTSFAQWGLLSFAQSNLLSLDPIFLQIGLTIFLFPFPTWVFIQLQRLFLTREG